MIQYPQINDINQNVTVTATGSGEATVTVPVIDCCVYWYLPFESDQVLKVSALCWPPLFSVWQMVSLYYALPKEKESDCQKFNLSLQLIPGQINYIHMGVSPHQPGRLFYHFTCVLQTNSSILIIHPGSFVWFFISVFRTNTFVRNMNWLNGQKNAFLPTDKRDEAERVYKLRIDVL